MRLSSRNGVLAGILAAGVLLAWYTSSARAQDFFAGPSYGFSRTYDPPGGWPRFGYYGLGGHGGQAWIGVPGLDAGYDQWRRDADRGGFFIQGWEQRPYPTYPGSGYYASPYGWPR